MASLSDCRSCDAGTYCESPGLTAPSGNCSARYYCVSNATTFRPTDGTTGNICPIGHYCPAGTGPNPLPCSPGLYMPQTLGEACFPCTAGFYCEDGSSQLECPAGFYCPANTGSVWQSCPAGTFSATLRLSQESGCTQCTGGYYCGSVNLTAVSGPCNAGYFCQSGVDTATPPGTVGTGGICPVGHYCEQGTVNPTPCPMGTFSNTTLRTSITDCNNCTAGYYCDTEGLTEPTGMCSAGFYCSSGATTAAPVTTDSTGGPCPIGKYCMIGTGVAQDCPAGTYNNVEQQSSCTVCPAGFYCVAGSSSPVACPNGMCPWV